MSFICQVCGDSVDANGFKTNPPDDGLPPKPMNCIPCRLEAMRQKQIVKTRPKQLPSEMFPPSLPYKDD